MVIFNYEHWQIVPVFNENDILTEANHFKINPVHTSKGKLNNLIILIKDMDTGRSGKGAQHATNIKVKKQINGENWDFCIKILNQHNQFDDEDFNGLNKKEKEIIKNFINHNRKIILKFWYEYKDEEVQEQCKRIIQNNVKKYNYLYYKGKGVAEYYD